MLNLDGDLDKILAIVREDASILSLLNLASADAVTIANQIIKRSRFGDLAGEERRLCIYPLTARATQSESLFEEMIEIDCHAPDVMDYMARRTIDRVATLLNNTRINGRYLKFKGSLGELSTATDFYCFGCRFGYYDPV